MLWNLVFQNGISAIDWKENPKKGLRQWKKVSLSWKRNLCVCLRETKKSFKFHVIILRYIRNVNLPFKKDFNFAEVLTKTSFFLYFRDHLKMAKETDK